MQTFYRQIKRNKPVRALEGGNTAIENEGDEQEEEEEEEEEDARGVENRQYIKEMLITHPVWKDGNYWEQALWQCAIEQVRA